MLFLLALGLLDRDRFIFGSATAAVAAFTVVIAFFRIREGAVFAVEINFPSLFCLASALFLESCHFHQLLEIINSGLVESGDVGLRLTPKCTQKIPVKIFGCFGHRSEMPLIELEIMFLVAILACGAFFNSFKLSKSNCGLKSVANLSAGFP